LFKPVGLKTIIDLLEDNGPDSAPPNSVRTLNAPSSNAGARSSSAPSGPPTTRR